MYLPPDHTINKDFLKEVLAEDKRLFTVSEIRMRHVPLYDELSVKKLFPLMKDDELFMAYFPTKMPGSRLPDRDYFFNILNTIHPKYVEGLVEHAVAQRNTAQNAAMEA